MAGPHVNIVLAFGIFAAVFWASGTIEPPPRVGSLEHNTPAAAALKPGDTIVAVDGRRPAGTSLDAQNSWVVREIGSHRCAGTPTPRSPARRSRSPGRRR